MNEKSQAATCSRCGVELAPDALKGLCPRCLMELNLMAPTEVPGETGPQGTQSSRPLPSLEEVARHFPQFQLLECLGRGGMGVVYKARQPKLNRVVALKILAPEKVAEPKFAERFEREAQALARLNHPNIVTVYDFGETDGLFFLTMEFVDGVSLRRLLQTRRIEPEEALTIVPRICEALQYAHDEGIVHRDIKPENLLLDKKGRIKIADFGIAKIVAGQGGAGTPQPTETTRAPNSAPDSARPASGLTQEQVLGTPNYMAPEQMEHPQKVDHRADIYSLGVVFYEMLTGELPLGRFQPPSKKVHIDVRLDEVVLHTLEKEPERRYQQASQVKTAVETIASAPPSRSAPASDPALLKAQARLNVAAIGLMVVGSINTLIFLLGGIGLLAATWGDFERGAVIGLFAASVLLVLSVVVVAGAVELHRRRNYALAVAAGILALITPSPFIPLGFGFGIMALVLLAKPRVKEGFGTAPQARGGVAWKVGLAVATILLALAALWMTVHQVAHREPSRTPLAETAADLGGGIQMQFLLIPAGSFTMGGSLADEAPAHRVTLSKPFYLGRYEVTQEQWDSVMPTNRSHSRGPKLPVSNVSWEDAQAFLKKLGERTGRRFALPTEAQWEYACRAAAPTAYSSGDGDAGLDEQAWFADNADGTPHPVGEKKPNPWGLYDMYGNVWERCADGFAPYRPSPATDPKRTASDGLHVIRGGAWTTQAQGLRCSNRNSDARGNSHVGLRCVLLADAVAQGQPLTGVLYIQQQLKLAKAGSYWAKYNLWDAYSHGEHGVEPNPAEAARLLPDLIKGVYLARFQPADGFHPASPAEFLNKVAENRQLRSWENRVGAAGFFRTQREGDKLVGSFLTSSPDKFKAALQTIPDIKLISMEPVTPELFLAHEAAREPPLRRNEVPGGVGTTTP